MRTYLKRLCLLLVGLVSLLSCDKDEPKVVTPPSLASTMWSGELETRNRQEEFYVAYKVEVFFKEDGKADLYLFKATDNSLAGGWEDTPYIYKGKSFQFPREDYPAGYGYITNSWLVVEHTKDHMFLVQIGGTKKLTLTRKY